MNKPVVFITGASSGIGAETAIELARNGYNLALFARRKEKLDEIALQCQQLGAQTLVLVGDVADYSVIKKAVENCLFALGGLDVLVVSHGVGKFDKLFVDDDEMFWEKTIDVNLKASMYLTQQVLTHLINQSKNTIHTQAIIYIASTAAKQVAANFAAYCASKFGLYGFGKAIFEEVRQFGIKVSMICPGWVKTDLATTQGLNLDESKMILPADIAQLVAYVLKTPQNVCPFDITIVPQRL